MEQLKFKLDNRRSNNQAEKLAIIKALDVIETQHVNHLHGQQDKPGLNKERQKPQPYRRRNQEESSKP